MDNSLKNQLRSLYEESFDDTKEYIDYFFENKFKPENTVILKNEDGRIISGTHIIYKKINYKGKIIDYPYVVAAATRAELRGKKIFSAVMSETLNRVNNEKHPFIGLYPFKHSYYAKYDFATVNYAVNFKLNNVFEDKNLQIIKFSNAEDADKLIPSVFKIYNDYCKAYTAYQYRDKILIRGRIRELFSDGGYILMISKNNKNIGYAMVSKELVSELFINDVSLIKGIKSLENMEINIVCGNFKDAEKVKDKLDIGNAAVKDYSMARIADIEDFFKNFRITCSEDLDFKIKITDLAKEDKILRIFNNKGFIDSEIYETYEYQISVTDLTRLVFGCSVEATLPGAFKDLFKNCNFLFTEEY